MKIMKFVALFSLLTFVLAVHDYVEAQYQVLHHVIGNGGVAVNNGGYRLNGTAGQPGIGIISSPSHINEAGFWYQAGNIVTSIESISNFLPKEFRLEQNYPNPFNPSTAINYQLSVLSFVDLSIYNSLGQKVVTLVSEKQPAGYYNVVWDAGRFSASVYFCRMEAGDPSTSSGQGYVKVIKLALVK